MSAPVAESSEGTLDAGSASAEEVAAALGVGVGDAVEPEGEPSEEPGEQGEEAENDLAAQLAEMRVEIARLKRENAAARVASKQAKVAPAETTDEVAAAVEQAKAEARLEFGIKLAGSEVKAALASVMTSEQASAFVEDLNLAKYVTEDGEPDADAIAALKARQVSLLGKRPAPKVGHGKTGTPVRKNNSELFGDAFAQALSLQ